MIFSDMHLASKYVDRKATRFASQHTIRHKVHSLRDYIALHAEFIGNPFPVLF